MRKNYSIFYLPIVVSVIFMNIARRPSSRRLLNVTFTYDTSLENITRARNPAGNSGCAYCRFVPPRCLHHRHWKSSNPCGKEAACLSRSDLKCWADITDLRVPGFAGRSLLSLLDEHKLRRVLSRMLDEEEFLSPYGIRSLSLYHLAHPYVFHAGGREYRVTYLPAESNTGMFGGNSNWRGPIWSPVNTLIISALLQFYLYYGNDFKVECPTGSGQLLTLYEVAEEIARRLSSIFLRDETGRRPVHGGTQKFQEDPHWRNLILFYEYFNGDIGAGLKAGHQTGWTGVIATLMDLFASLNAEQLLVGGIMGDPEQGLKA